jgi:SAM-dependent methyltransferase
MADIHIEKNLQIYNAPDVTAYYAALNYLTPCERLLFESYISPGSAVLDLGVGGGRTTPYLASRATRYVGVDNAEAMVRACQQKFPDLEFVTADAGDLSAFPDAVFDAVVFAFNGIDFVLPENTRRQCCTHVHRILKPGGAFIFSSHNARALLVRPGWSRERLERIAYRFTGNSKAIHRVILATLTSMRAALALVQACAASFLRMARRLPTRVFWQGEGELLDSAHGGLFTHFSVPRRVVSELGAASLRFERVLGNAYPQSNHPLTTDWYYYVFVKPIEK